MRMIVLALAMVTGCAGGGYRQTRVLGEQEYVAFADRPSGGYAPMAPPDCTAGDTECHGQWLADIQIGERGGTIERVLQTGSGFVVYVRASADCTGEPAPNWKLLLRKPVVHVEVVHLGTPPACSAPQQARGSGRAGLDGTM